MARLGGYRHIEGHHRQGTRERRGGRGRRDDGERNVEAELIGPPTEKFRVGDDVETRNVELAASMPDCKRKVGADPGRLAERQCQWLHDFASVAYLSSGILYSIIAWRRKLSR
jgi:hypothetical protein